MSVSCLAYSPTLKMEVIYSSETSVDFQWITCSYISEDRALHNHRCEKFKYYPGICLETLSKTTTISQDNRSPCRNLKMEAPK
jgi:hypothetical protein